MSGARTFFYALAECSAIGFGAYGVDSGAGPELADRFVDLGADFRMVKATMPAIIALQASGKLKAAIADDVIRGKNLIYDRYHLLVRFIAAPVPPSEPPVPSAACWWASWGRTSFSSWASTPRWISAPRLVPASPRPNSFRSRKECTRTACGKPPTRAGPTRRPYPAQRFSHGSRLHLPREADALLSRRFIDLHFHGEPFDRAERAHDKNIRMLDFPPFFLASYRCTYILLP